MELIFGAIFVGLVKYVAPVIVFLVQKIKNILKVSGKTWGYILSGVVSAGLTLLIKLVGPNLVWMLLAFLPEFPGGAAPVFPDAAQNAFYIVFAIVLGAVSGGWYDFEKMKNGK